MGIKVIVCGGRNYLDREKVYHTLDLIHKRKPISWIVHGGARGADSIASEWAKEREIPEIVYLPEWGKYGNSAGPVRNGKMAEDGADLCVAFPGGSGTQDMISKASIRGIEVIRI